MRAQFETSQSPREFLTEDLLPDLHPDTVDGEYLDHYSAEQLVDYTYRVGTKVDQVGDGNCLVPNDVGGFESAEYENPSAHVASVLVPEDELGGTLSVQFEGYVGQYINVETPSGYFDHAEIPAVEIEGQEYTLYMDERPYPTSVPPAKFRLESDPVDLDETTTFQDEVELNSEKTLLASRNTRTGEEDRSPMAHDLQTFGTITDFDEPTVDVYHGRPSINVVVEVTVEMDIPEDQSPDTSRTYARVTTTVRNETSVDENNEQAWAAHRILFPSASLQFEETDVAFPPQQHDVHLEQALEAQEDATGGSPFESAYRQRDCYLTRVVTPFAERWGECDTLVTDPEFRTTSFGLYDYVEQEPRQAEHQLDELVQMSDAELVEAMSHIAERSDELEAGGDLLRHLRGVLLTLRHYLKPGLPPLGSDEYEQGVMASEEPILRKFQWAAIQERVEALLDNETDPLVVQAPTSAGKTVVYYASTMLTVFYRDTRAAFPFPTVMLTEDKLQEVIDLAYAYNQHVRDTEYQTVESLPAHEFSVGVALGKQESDYGSSEYIHTRDLIEYIGDCHSCDGDVTTVCADCMCSSRRCRDSDDDHRHIAKCSDCDFTYDFVFDTIRTSQYLPSVTVGTPEKFFTMPTVEVFSDHSTKSTLPFYGAPHTECDSCGRALTDMDAWRVINDEDGVFCSVCDGRDQFNEVDWSVREPDSETANHDPIGHVVLDETHMYTGQFGITVSVIIRFFEVLASRLRSGESRDRDTWEISADSGTATISNRLEHISQLLSVSEEQIRPIPASGEHGDYFDSNREQVRYRVVAGTPVGTSNRESFRQSVVRAYDDLHNDGAETHSEGPGAGFRNDFEAALSQAGGERSIEAYELLLGYVYRKADGYALREGISDLNEEIGDGDLGTLPFLSGEASRNELRSLFESGRPSRSQVVLANLVVSLGIDIPALNNLILFGAPRSMSEQMQTIGRTGRGAPAGHANIHLYPGKPRDMQIQRNFHEILSQIDDYYDAAAIQPTNPHIADILFEYVLAPFITLEFGIREDPADPNNLHIVQDLDNMFDMYETGVPPRRNRHVIALYNDMQQIFCPANLGLEEALQELIEDQLREQLLDYTGTESRPNAWRDEAVRNQGNDNSMNINMWFRNDIGDLELRGVSDISLSLTTEWTTEAEVDL